MTVLPEWLPVPPSPTGEHPLTRRALREQGARIRAREATLAELVADTVPAWARALGSCPDGAPDRTLWLHTAGRAAVFRDQFQVLGNDPSHPLGVRPSETDLSHPHARVQARAFEEVSQVWEAVTGQALPGSAHVPGRHEPAHREREATGEVEATPPAPEITR